MNLNEAADLLGLSPAATLSDARSAYLAGIAAAKDELGAESSEFRDKAALLEEAYEAFKSPEQSTTSGAPANSTKQSRSLGKSIGLTAAILGGGLLLLGGVFAVTSSGDSDPTPNSDSTSKVEATNEPDPEQGSLSGTPDNGQSGFLNTCWKEGVFSDVNDEEGSVSEVSCSSAHDWVVSSEVRDPSECPGQYLESGDDQSQWVLCLRRAF